MTYRLYRLGTTVYYGVGAQKNVSKTEVWSRFCDVHMLHSFVIHILPLLFMLKILTGSAVSFCNRFRGIVGLDEKNCSINRR